MQSMTGQTYDEERDDLVSKAVDRRFPHYSADDKIRELARVQYPLSLKNGQIQFVIDLDKTKDSDRIGHACTECGSELTPVFLESNPHFRHLSATCTGKGALESFLHRTAKNIAANLDGIHIAPILAVSKKFPEIREIAFADGFLPFVDGECEKRRPRYTPDVTARMTGFPPDRPLLIEIRVTHATDDEKAERVAADGLDMIEIDLRELIKDARSNEGMPRAEELIRKAVMGLSGYDQMRKWIYSGVGAELEERVRVRELAREYREAFVEYAAHVRSLKSMIEAIGVPHQDEAIAAARKSLEHVDIVSTWIGNEEKDHLEVANRLRVAVARRADLRLDGQRIATVSDLRGDMTFQQADAALEAIRSLEANIGDLDRAMKDLPIYARSTVEGCRQMTPNTVESLGLVREYSAGFETRKASIRAIFKRITAAVPSLPETVASIDAALQAAQAGHRLFHASTIKKLETIEATDQVRTPAPANAPTNAPKEAYPECRTRSLQMRGMGIFLGCARVQAEDDDLLGEGSDCFTTNETVNLFFAEAAKLDYAVGFFPDLMETRLDFLGGMTVEKALRYVRSREHFPRLLEAIRIAEFPGSNRPADEAWIPFCRSHESQNAKAGKLSA